MQLAVKLALPLQLHSALLVFLAIFCISLTSVSLPVLKDTSKMVLFAHNVNQLVPLVTEQKILIACRATKQENITL